MPVLDSLSQIYNNVVDEAVKMIVGDAITTCEEKNSSVRDNDIIEKNCSALDFSVGENIGLNFKSVTLRDESNDRGDIKKTAKVCLASASISTELWGDYQIGVGCIDVSVEGNLAVARVVPSVSASVLQATATQEVPLLNNECRITTQESVMVGVAGMSSSSLGVNAGVDVGIRTNGVSVSAPVNKARTIVVGGSIKTDCY